MSHTSLMIVADEFCANGANPDTIECSGVLVGLGWLAAAILISVAVAIPLMVWAFGGFSRRKRHR